MPDDSLLPSKGHMSTIINLSLKRISGCARELLLLFPQAGSMGVF